MWVEIGLVALASLPCAIYALHQYRYCRRWEQNYVKLMMLDLSWQRQFAAFKWAVNSGRYLEAHQILQDQASALEAAIREAG